MNLYKIAALSLMIISAASCAEMLKSAATGALGLGSSDGIEADLTIGKKQSEVSTEVVAKKTHQTTTTTINAETVTYTPPLPTKTVSDNSTQGFVIIGMSLFIGGLVYRAYIRRKYKKQD